MHKITAVVLLVLAILATGCSSETAEKTKFNAGIKFTNLNDSTYIFRVESLPGYDSVLEKVTVESTDIIPKEYSAAIYTIKYLQKSVYDAFPDSMHIQEKKYEHSLPKDESLISNLQEIEIEGIIYYDYDFKVTEDYKWTSAPEQNITVIDQFFNHLYLLENGNAFLSSTSEPITARNIIDVTTCKIDSLIPVEDIVVVIKDQSGSREINYNIGDVLELLPGNNEIFVKFGNKIIDFINVDVNKGDTISLLIEGEEKIILLP